MLARSLRFGQPEKTKLYDKILEVLESKEGVERDGVSLTSGQDRLCQEGQGGGRKPYIAYYVRIYNS